MGVAGALWFGGLVSGLGVEPAYAAKPGSTTPTVSISEFRSLEFGTVAGSADGSSTLVMSPAGVLTATGYGVVIKGTRSEEHTSELQSPYVNSYAVFCLKKKKNKTKA